MNAALSHSNLDVNAMDSVTELRHRPPISVNSTIMKPHKKIIPFSETRDFTLPEDNGVWQRLKEVDGLYQYLPLTSSDIDFDKLYPNLKHKNHALTAPADFRNVMEELVGKKSTSSTPPPKSSSSSSTSSKTKTRFSLSSSSSDEVEQEKPEKPIRSLIHSNLRKNSSSHNQLNDEIIQRARNHSGELPVTPVPVHPLLQNIDESKLEKAISLFKEKPAQGVKHLIAEKIINDNPKDIGTFLFVCDKFDKVQLGEYLSRGVANNNVDDTATEILNIFVSHFNFEHMDFDLALRFFLYRFRLPGEAQKIDRLMKIFAAKYFEVHKDDNIFKNELYVYAISFGTIMLNTDLYNEHVKYKMTLKQFIDNIQYFNTNGPPATDIPVDFLEDLYFKIEIDEIKMEKERTLLPNALKRSWMFVYAKTGMGSSRWKRRWMVLSDNCLFIFRKYDDERVIYKLGLQNASISVVGKEKGRQFCLWLHLPPSNMITKGFANYTQKSPYTTSDDTKIHILLSANHTIDISLWSRAIEHCIVNSSAPPENTLSKSSNNNNNNSSNSNSNKS